ncbi:uncharacterized protein LOC142344704 [Convolutriloba macropyga]|uniref:uncharacterized protein LOC142344704 n=1 Tax=Convolutriloba macropyga TaxID=536237 RepID=UPI003F522E0F
MKYCHVYPTQFFFNKIINLRDEENDTVVNCKAEHPAKNLTITVNDEMENQPPLPQSSPLSNPPLAHDDEEDEETATCPHCGLEDEDTEHWLLRCPNWKNQRKKMGISQDPTVIQNEPEKVTEFVAVAAQQPPNQ